MSPTTATLKGQIWLLRSVKASYHGSKVPQLIEPSKKPTPQSVFSFEKQEYDDKNQISSNQVKVLLEVYA